MSHWSNLESDPWFKGPKVKPSHAGAGRAWVQLFIGIAVGGLFFYFGLTTLAYVVWGIGGTIGILSIASAQIRNQLQTTFARLGEWLGRSLAAVCLTPIFFIGFTAVRALDWVAGRDPLQLKDGTTEPTFWARCDHDDRRLANIGRSFVTEPPSASGSLMRPLLLAGLVLLVGGELMLQAMGYGSPVLYAEHPVIGYLPQANQEVKRLGNRISINSFGMRAPDVTKEKPKDTFRILMLGDSCLYGGSYVDQDDIYARRVAKTLQAQVGDRKVEVLNMGVNAWGGFNKLGYVQTHGNFDADLAVIALPLGDIQRPYKSLGDVPFMPAANPPRFGIEEVAYHLVWRWREGKRGNRNDTADARFANGLATYVKLADTLSAMGTEVMFEVLPSRSAGTSSPTAKEQSVVDKLVAATKGRFDVGYPKGLFAGHGDADQLYKDFVHLDTVGHAIYADYFSGQVRKQSARWRAFAGVSSL